MSDIAVSVDGLSKLYRIGQRERYYTLRDSIARVLTAPFQRSPRRQIANTFVAPREPASLHPSGNGQEMIWALKDVSFEIRRGEVVGIIGRNGAGKSTLLKILSRITEPTEGEARVYGRVGSLLEVGTGFHPELSGRENIYLSGAILGMKKKEIERNFDAIVDFAEVEKFIDTSVKHYSSGMYMRLAFSVAAHLEPEILTVDEILAVGDAAFQKKCLGKMGDVAQEGRTVLFVSHNMDAIQRLCERCLWFDSGSVVLDGEAEATAATYLRQLHGDLRAHYQTAQSSQSLPIQRAHLIETELLNAQGERCQNLRFGEPFSIRMLWEHAKQIEGVAYAIRIYDDRDRFLSAANTLNSGLEIESSGTHEVQCKFAENVLVPGEYYVSVGCYIRPHTALCVVESCLKLLVLDVPYRASHGFNILGNPVFALHPSWTQEK